MSNPSRSTTPTWYNPIITEQPSAEFKKTNHLFRCYENITFKAQQYQKHLSTLNKVAGYATAIIYVAAIVSSVVFCAIFSPALIPLTVLAAYSSFPQALAFVQSRLQVAKESAEAAKAVQSMRSYLESNESPKSQDEVNNYLQGLQIDPSSVLGKQHNQILALIAHREYWQKQLSTTLSALQAKDDERLQHQTHYPNEVHQIRTLELETLSLEEAAILAKINTAFYQTLLMNPNYEYERDAIVKFNGVLGLQPNESPLATLGKRFLDARFAKNNAHIASFTNPLTGNVYKADRQALLNASIHEIVRVFCWTTSLS